MKSKEPSTRAELVRLRRSQKSQERLTRAVQKSHTPSMTQSVVIRGGGRGTPVMNRTSSPVRRHVTIPLNKSGTEMLLPSMPLVKPGWRILSGFLVILFCLSIIYATSAEPFQVIKPVFIGLKRLTANDVEAVSKLSGKSIFSVNPTDLKKKLEEAYGELTDISITLSLPAGVSISMRERKPILAWKHGDYVRWIDAEGVIFLPRGEAGNIITIQGETKPPLIAPEKDLNNITLPSPDGALLPSSSPINEKAQQNQMDPTILAASLKLSTILAPNTDLAYSGIAGLGWVDPNGIKIYIGLSLENLDSKIDLYQSIAKKLAVLGIEPTMISVERISSPYYRLD